VKAIIYEVGSAPASGALDLAGRALLVRQLQWLRTLGIEEVGVEIVDGPLALDCAELVLGQDPLCARCTAIPSRAPLGVEELARRLDFASDELFLALPANVVVEAELELPTVATNISLGPPPFAPEERAIAIAFRTLRELAGEAEPRSGWAIAVEHAAAAHTLSCAAIAGHAEGLLVHAAQVKPGIWYARGARVAEDATLLAPVLVGPDARVFARSRLGPNVVVGRQAIVEREAVLSEVSIAPCTLVGEDARVRQAYVDASGFTSFVDGTRTEIRDPLLLSTLAPASGSVGARFLAGLLVLALLLPWSAVGAVARLLGRQPLTTRPFRASVLLEGTLQIALLDVVPPLCDVLLGRRDLVGVSERALAAAPGWNERARPGAIDVGAALTGGSAEMERCMVPWYLRNKRFALDRQLVLRSLRGVIRPAEEQPRSGSF
jgi:hypothetical protein